MAETRKPPREQYREQVREEAKRLAWEQIATAGASALSVNAIAKRMAMSGPALYRYFTNRDELITDLIRDAFRNLAEAFRRAVTAGADLHALAHVLRDWALEDPHRYLLVYGTPVPGYRAPDDVTAAASEIMAALLDACTALEVDTDTVFTEHLRHHRQWMGGHPASPAVVHLALSFWTALHGVLSLELAGHFAGMGFDPAVLFTAELDRLLGGR
ncbi:TetR/AcrR family transcriptional regulator [Umezawaea sp. Da 62-37]|uniref:TetR/AcrR family transcriptional regulator n=1 Tax=Umezawaea sp. Da 62-37 TaxID=3075927 RepID=UPI0028F6F4F6|nr:TetR/AcrR family transcriptional regulator [Umezawaea sp. Da 62-37]WNV87703.1 TetR/AcrR family transcriptional regulator [Umezawaea sp. Da 62-37]